jgi:hypothetical protein
MFVFQGLLHIKANANLYEKEAKSQYQSKAHMSRLPLTEIQRDRSLQSFCMCAIAMRFERDKNAISCRCGEHKNKVAVCIKFCECSGHWIWSAQHTQHKVSSRAFLNLGIRLCYTKHDTFDCKIYTRQCEIGREISGADLNCKVPHWLSEHQAHAIFWRNFNAFHQHARDWAFHVVILSAQQS